MNATQRRLHSYRRRSAIGELAAAPRLVRGATPTAGPGGVAFETVLAGHAARVELPPRPCALLLVAGPAPRIPGAGIGTVSVEPGAGPDALAAVADALARLPETRALPLALAGRGDGTAAALAAAAALGPRLGALLLDREPPVGPVCLVPTHFGALDSGEAAAFLASELHREATPALDRRRRRLLGRRLERRLRRDCRRRSGGPLSGRVRAGLSALAASIAFTLSFGLGAGTAQAAWTQTTWDTATGALTFTSNNGSDQLTLTCNGGFIEYNTGSGPTQFPNGVFNAPCLAGTSLLVTGNGGADSIDLSGVLNSDYTALGPGDVTVLGGGGSDSISGPQGTTANSLSGDALDDTIIGGSGTDRIVPGEGDDSVSGGGLNDTIDFSAAVNPISFDAGTGKATGQATSTDTVSGVESAFGGPEDDTLIAGGASSSLVGNGGADDLDGASGGPSTIAGGAGNDTLDSQSATHADSMDGGSGNDNINGRGGNDTMFGGDNDDTIQGGDTGNDVIEGDAGNDIASYTQAGSGLVIDLSGSVFADDTVTGAGTDTLGSIEGAFGTDSDDTLIGDDSANTLTGEPGNDSIDGNQGDDFIDGGDDGDTLDGEQGANTLEGGSENDLLASFPTNASESLLGEAGADTLTGGTSASTLDGGTSGDSLTGGGAADSIEGGDGVDTLQGLAGGDTLSAGNEGDSIIGDSGADSVLAGSGNDVVDLDGIGGGSSDSDDDTLSGGTGTDTLTQFDGTSPVSYSFDDDKFSGAGTDGINSIERVSLSTGVGHDSLDAAGFSGSVTLVGGSGDNTIRGGAAADSLTGGSGENRVIVGGNTNHTVGAGTITSGGVTDTLSQIDEVSVTGGASANAIDASAFAGTVTLDGANGNDTLAGGLGFFAEDSLIGGGGTDRVVHTEDQNQVLTDTSLTSGSGGGQEIDTLSNIEQASLTGGATSNSIDASAFSGSVTIDAQAGIDTLLAGPGNDSLVGGADSGDRVIQQADASQTLTDSQLTGLGTDTLSGVERASLSGGASANELDASGFTGGAVTLDAAGGNNDTVLGGSQNDSLIGGGGTGDRVEQVSDTNQTLTGGSLVAGSNDTLNGIETASLTGGASANNIDASGFASGPVTLSGEGASDTLTGTAFGDSLHAGTGTDRMVASADADLTLSDTLLGISGPVDDDTISGFDEASLVAGLADNTIDTSGFSGPTTVQASGGDDTIISGDASDQIFGGGDAGDLYKRTADTDFSISSVIVTAAGMGADTVSSVADISLTGGPGDNSLDGSGSASFDSKVLDGAGGSDTVVGGGNPETLLGGAGNDSLPSGGTFADLVDGGADADTILGDGQDSIRGSGGDDHMTTTFNPAEVLGGTGTDRVIHVGADIDLDPTQLVDGTDTVDIDSFEQASLSGTTAGNSFDASDFNGPVTMFGDAGFDEFTGTSGNDSIDGGADFGDRVIQTSASNVDLGDTLITGDGNDTLANMEGASLTGTAAAQQIDASDFTGAPASSGVTMAALGGDDTLIASAGAAGDSLDAGGGTGDRLVKANDVAQVDLGDTLLDESGFNDDTLAGFETASLTGGSSANDMDASGFSGGNVTLSALGGTDTLLGSPNAGDSLDAGTGTDRISANGDVDFTLADTLIAAGADVDSIAGFESASLDGGGGDNDFDAAGFSGPVTMSGYNGDDTFEGGAASDLIVGGANTNEIRQTADADQTLTSTLLTGRGSDSISQIDSATLTGGASDNDLDASGFFAGPVELDGAAGDDSLEGTNDPDLLTGGADDDTLAGGQDDDTLTGGTGTDFVIHQGSDAVLTDNQLTGSGTNSLSSIELASLDGSSAAETIDAGAFSGVVTVDALGSNDTIIGAAGDDSLNGNTGSDYLFQTSDAALQEFTDTQATGDGTDTIAGLERASLTGGASANRIDASGATGSFGVTIDGAGAGDTLTGTVQADSLFGGPGTDEVRQQGSTPNQTLNDTLLTGTGSDSLDSFEQASLLGTTGPNIISATAFTNGPVSVDGALGNDTISGSGANDSLDGGGANDNVDAGGGTDTLVGDDGVDTLAGGLGADSLDGGVDEDELTGDDGADTLDGGDAADTLTGGDGADQLDGRAGSDSVAGGLLPDTLTGETGVDTLDGGDGADSISGGDDGDQLAGGTGANTLAGDGGSDALTGGPDADSLDGGVQADTLDGGDGANSLTGGTGADSITGGSDADRLVEQFDTDLTLTDALLTGGAESDSLAGIDSASLSGGAASNTLDASAFSGQVSLDGSGGADSLVGSAQADALTGGPGGDTLSGLAGNDVHNTTDGVVDENLCGPGDDTLNADDIDTAADCETVNATDTTPPETTIDSGPANGQVITSSSPTFVFSSNEPGSTFQCSVDNGPFTPCTSPKTVTGLGNGLHSFAVRATDPGSNTDASPATRGFVVDLPDPPPADTTPPTLKLSGKKKQSDKKKVVVTANCDELCDLDAEGTIKVPKIKKGKPKKKKTYKLVPVGKDDVAAGKDKKLKLKVKGKKGQKALKKALKVKKATSKATVEVTATDAARNAKTKKFKVKVKKSGKKKKR